MLIATGSSVYSQEYTLVAEQRELSLQMFYLACTVFLKMDPMFEQLVDFNPSLGFWLLLKNQKISNTASVCSKLKPSWPEMTRVAILMNDHPDLLHCCLAPVQTGVYLLSPHLCTTLPSPPTTTPTPTQLMTCRLEVTFWRERYRWK